MNKELLMMNHFTKTISVLLVASALSACSTIASQKPDEIVRQGVQRSLVRDNQFEFTGKIQLKLTPSADEKLPEIDKKQAQIEQLSTEIEHLSASSASPKASSNHASKKIAQHKKVSQMAEKNGLLEAAQAEHEALIGHYANQKLADILSERITITFSGAVDIPQGQIELTPAFRYDSKNTYAVAHIPMHFDMRKMNLIMDYHGLSELSDIKNRTSNPKLVLGDKNLAVHLTGEDHDVAASRQLISRIPKALDAGFAALDKNAFVFLPMDEAGQKAGARYRIGLKMTAEESKRFYLAMLNNMAELLKQSKLQNQDDDSSQMNQALQELKKLLSDENNEENEAEAKTNQNHTEQQVKEKPVLSDFNVNYYFSRQGQLVAIRRSVEVSTLLRLLDSDSNRRGKLVLWTQLHYTKHPKFAVKSNPEDILILEPEEVEKIIFH